jgi:hypothetical protein
VISRTRAAICAALFVLLLLPQSFFAEDVTPTPVASYVNRPEIIEKEGKRAAAILIDRKVWHGDQLFDEAVWTKWTAEHESGTNVVLFAPRASGSEARLLLARAIKAEGLRITLLGDDAKAVTPVSVLKQNKKP